MDDYCYAKMATSAKREHERESTSSKSPTEIKTKDEDIRWLIGHPKKLTPQLQRGICTLKKEVSQPPHLKKEKVELCITQKGECLLGREEADLTKFPLSILSVKTEDDEEKPQVNNLLAPLSDSEAEDEVEVTLSSDTDCEDVQQLIGHPKELSPRPQGPGSMLKQEGPFPSHIKKEEEELWITQEGECLLGREEADYTKFPLSILSVKTEDDEEKPQGDKLLAPLSDSEAEDEIEEPLSSDTDCETDIRTHTDNKHLKCPKRKTDTEPVPCSVCAKKFPNKSELTRHVRTHTGEKPFSCSICGKRFTLKGNLVKHMKTHTGEKPFICSVCGKRFILKGNLVTHMKMHTGEKPFSCSVCGKRFILKADMVKHMRTHTGEKPFSCLVCGKRFTLRANLVTHMKTQEKKHLIDCLP
ncbi:uncharacterized protein [Nerophis lumbriciformis]|uniref:uncharacterized protein n=1 Tax=Nerophis lumbriciformis TaxID=546530 RepID=UPI003BAC7A37